MPELPEVENVKRSLESLGASGQRFVEVKLLSPKLRTPLKALIGRKLPGQSIVAVRRRAKFLLFETEDFCLLNHLGMTGSWRPSNSKNKHLKHDHVILKFASGLNLVFNDPRRFGLLELIEKKRVGSHTWLKNLGPEPLTEEFSGEYLYKITRKLKSPIKNVIMDQKRVVGVGNIYASEALFAAKIRPTRPAGKINRCEAELLVTEIKTVLMRAIAAGGSTIRDYKNTNGQSGRFQNHFSVYGRGKKACRLCNTSIRSKFIGQRNTFWCPQCQK